MDLVSESVISVCFLQRTFYGPFARTSFFPRSLNVGSSQDSLHFSPKGPFPR
jgi:hypothetical protein